MSGNAVARTNFRVSKNKVVGKDVVVVVIITVDVGG
jgi:hypothetical protein